MKTKPRTLKLLITLFSAVTTTAAFGQTTYTWTGASDGTNFSTMGNWGPTGVPRGCGGSQDTAQWDGLTTTNLVLTYNDPVSCEFGSAGVNLVLTANQTNSVQIISPVALSSSLSVFAITNNSASAAFSLGNSSANVLSITMRPAGATHDWVNNSTNPAVIYPNVRWQAGGGTIYTLIFDGTGNWFVTNGLNNSGVGTVLAKQGAGTLTWAGPSIPNAMGFSPINSPFTIGGGTVVLAWADTFLNNVAIANNGTLLKYDAPAQSQTLNGVISGTGALQVNNGALTLGGQNTYTGTNLFTGGELIVNGPENAGVSGPLGVGGTISFNGGVLGFSVNNTFDYSSRFNAAAGQAYNIDTGGLPVTFTTGLTSSGGSLTKLGAGTLTLAGANSYSGATTINSGKLVFQGSKSGSGDITVADGAALGITATGTQVTPGTLTLGSSSGCTLEFNNVTSTTTAPLAAGTLSSAGTTTINIIGGTFAVGQSYPLLTWTGGSAPTVSLGTLNGASGNLSISGNTLYLNITALTYTWTGAGDRVSLANPTNWSPQGLPSGATQDTAQWNGVTTTNLVITYGTVSLPGTGFASLGINLVMTTNQTNSVQVISSASVSAGVGVNNIEVASGAGAFTWGDTTASNLLTFGRPAGAVHHFVNNSTNPATINKSVRWQAGGGNGYTYDFSGMGNWIVNSYLMPDSSAFSASYIQVDGPGMVFWSAGRTGEYSPNAPLGAVTIYGGALALKSAFPLYDILGNVPITNNATFVFDAASQSQTLSGVISGTGQLIVNNGTLTLAGQNTYSGTTTVSNGTLIINGGNAAAATIVNGGMLGGTGALSGPVTLATGTALAPGAPVGSVGTLTISNDLTLGGNLTIEVNKSVSPSNDFVVVLGVLTNTGTGTVTVANLGPALAVGDTFTLFSKLVQNGAALTVTGAGAAWANHLAVDGSITVTAITRPTLNFTQTGGSLQFSWSANFGSYKLQSQTNSLTKGLGYNWSDYPGGATSPVTVPMDAMQDTVFFRLVSTP